MFTDFNKQGETMKNLIALIILLTIGACSTQQGVRTVQQATAPAPVNPQHIRIYKVKWENVKTLDQIKTIMGHMNFQYILNLDDPEDLKKEKQIKEFSEEVRP